MATRTNMVTTTAKEMTTTTAPMTECLPFEWSMAAAVEVVVEAAVAAGLMLDGWKGRRNIGGGGE